MLHKTATEESQDRCSTRESCASMIRNKARRLREHSVSLDKLADQLDRGSINGEGEEALWKELVSKQF